MANKDRSSFFFFFSVWSFFFRKKIAWTTKCMDNFSLELNHTRGLVFQFWGRFKKIVESVGVCSASDLVPVGRLVGSAF